MRAHSQLCAPVSIQLFAHCNPHLGSHGAHLVYNCEVAAGSSLLCTGSVARVLGTGETALSKTEREWGWEGRKCGQQQATGLFICLKVSQGGNVTLANARKTQEFSTNTQWTKSVPVQPQLG